MNSLEILKEKYAQFRSLNLSAVEEVELMPLFTHILEGLESHAKKLSMTANGLGTNKYTASYQKEHLQRVAAENRESAKQNAELMLERLERDLLACGTALSTASMAGRVVTDPIEKLTQELRDREVRADLAKMDPSERINVLFDSVKNGDASILDALQRGPATKRTLVQPEELESASKEYIRKVAPVQVEALEQMKSVMEKGKAAMSLMDVALNYVDQQSGVTTQTPVKAY